MVYLKPTPRGIEEKIYSRQYVYMPCTYKGKITGMGYREDRAANPRATLLKPPDTTPVPPLPAVLDTR